MKRIWLLAGLVWTIVGGVYVYGLFLGSVPQEEIVYSSSVVSNSFQASVAPTPSEVKVFVTGDVMPGRMVNKRLRELDDFDYPFVHMLFSEADITFINLESPVVDGCPTRTDGFKFCADVRILPALKRAGVTVANIANNHIANEGMTGITQTRKLLEANQIFYTGTAKPVVIEKNGLRIGFLGFNDVGACPQEIECADVTLIEDRISQLKTTVDFVVVQFHWGTEYTHTPTSRQRTLAHVSIDAGADLVVGNHPHWVQETETYKNSFIAYSHGNFLFDQQWSSETQQGAVGVYVFSSRGLVSHELRPMIIDRSFQPRWADSGI